MEHLEGLVRMWCVMLSGIEKRNLRGCGLGAFLGLRQVRMEPEFLDACLHYWDLAYHVFRFPDGEVCPLVEEFAAIGGWTRIVTPVCVRQELGYQRNMQNFLKMTRLETEDLFLDGRLNMIRLCQKFMNYDDGSIGVVARRRALALCLVHCFMFPDSVDGMGFGEARLVCVVQQMEMGYNPAALILAETILGLDDRACNRVHAYRGCPLILQVWLMERLSVLGAIPYGVSYTAAGVTSRGLRWMGPNGRPRDYFSTFVRASAIRWVVPWWEVTSVTGSAVGDGPSGVMLCGFDIGVFIHPLRVRRQMGYAQFIPGQDTTIQDLVVLNNQITDAWSRGWALRPRWQVAGIPATVRVSRSYIRWTTATTTRQRARLRAIEQNEPPPTSAFDPVRFGRGSRGSSSSGSAASMETELSHLGFIMVNAPGQDGSDRAPHMG